MLLGITLLLVYASSVCCQNSTEASVQRHTAEVNQLDNIQTSGQDNTHPIVSKSQNTGTQQDVSLIDNILDKTLNPQTLNAGFPHSTLTNIKFANEGRLSLKPEILSIVGPTPTDSQTSNKILGIISNNGMSNTDAFFGQSNADQQYILVPTNTGNAKVNENDFLSNVYFGGQNDVVTGDINTQNELGLNHNRKSASQAAQNILLTHGPNSGGILGLIDAGSTASSGTNVLLGINGISDINNAVNVNNVAGLDQGPLPNGIVALNDGTLINLGTGINGAILNESASGDHNFGLFQDPGQGTLNLIDLTGGANIETNVNGIVGIRDISQIEGQNGIHEINRAHVKKGTQVIDQINPGHVLNNDVNSLQFIDLGSNQASHSTAGLNEALLIANPSAAGDLVAIADPGTTHSVGTNQVVGLHSGGSAGVVELLSLDGGIGINQPSRIENILGLNDALLLNSDIRGSSSTSMLGVNHIPNSNNVIGFYSAATGTEPLNVLSFNDGLNTGNLVLLNHGGSNPVSNFGRVQPGVSGSEISLTSAQYLNMYPSKLSANQINGIFSFDTSHQTNGTQVEPRGLKLNGTVQNNFNTSGLRDLIGLKSGNQLMHLTDSPRPLSLVSGLSVDGNNFIPISANTGSTLGSSQHLNDAGVLSQNSLIMDGIAFDNPSVIPQTNPAYVHSGRLPSIDNITATNLSLSNTRVDELMKQGNIISIADLLSLNNTRNASLLNKNAVQEMNHRTFVNTETVAQPTRLTDPGESNVKQLNNDASVTTRKSGIGQEKNNQDISLGQETSEKVNQTGSNTDKEGIFSQNSPTTTANATKSLNAVKDVHPNNTVMLSEVHDSGTFFDIAPGAIDNVISIQHLKEAALAHVPHNGSDTNIGKQPDKLNEAPGIMPDSGSVLAAWATESAPLNNSSSMTAGEVLHVYNEPYYFAWNSSIPEEWQISDANYTLGQNESYYNEYVQDTYAGDPILSMTNTEAYYETNFTSGIVNGSLGNNIIYAPDNMFTNEQNTSIDMTHTDFIADTSIQAPLEIQPMPHNLPNDKKQNAVVGEEVSITGNDWATVDITKPLLIENTESGIIVTNLVNENATAKDSVRTMDTVDKIQTVSQQSTKTNNLQSNDNTIATTDNNTHPKHSVLSAVNSSVTNKKGQQDVVKTTQNVHDNIIDNVAQDSNHPPAGTVLAISLNSEGNFLIGDVVSFSDLHSNSTQPAQGTIPTHFGIEKQRKPTEKSSESGSFDVNNNLSMINNEIMSTTNIKQTDINQKETTGNGVANVHKEASNIPAKMTAAEVSRNDVSQKPPSTDTNPVISSTEVKSVANNMINNIVDPKHSAKVDFPILPDTEVILGEGLGIRTNTAANDMLVLGDGFNVMNDGHLGFETTSNNPAPAATTELDMPTRIITNTSTEIDKNNAGAIHSMHTDVITGLTTPVNDALATPVSSTLDTFLHDVVYGNGSSETGLSQESFVFGRGDGLGSLDLIHIQTPSRNVEHTTSPIGQSANRLQEATLQTSTNETFVNEKAQKAMTDTVVRPPVEFLGQSATSLVDTSPRAETRAIGNNNMVTETFRDTSRNSRTFILRNLNGPNLKNNDLILIQTVDSNANDSSSNSTLNALNITNSLRLTTGEIQSDPVAITDRFGVANTVYEIASNNINNVDPLSIDPVNTLQMPISPARRKSASTDIASTPNQVILRLSKSIGLGDIFGANDFLSKSNASSNINNSTQRATLASTTIDFSTQSASSTDGFAQNDGISTIVGNVEPDVVPFLPGNGPNNRTAQFDLSMPDVIENVSSPISTTDGFIQTTFESSAARDPSRIRSKQLVLKPSSVVSPTLRLDSRLTGRRTFIPSASSSLSGTGSSVVNNINRVTGRGGTRVLQLPGRGGDSRPVLALFSRRGSSPRRSLLLLRRPQTSSDSSARIRSRPSSGVRRLEARRIRFRGVPLFDRLARRPRGDVSRFLVPPRLLRAPRSRRGGMGLSARGRISRRPPRIASLRRPLARNDLPTRDIGSVPSGSRDDTMSRLASARLLPDRRGRVFGETGPRIRPLAARRIRPGPLSRSLRPRRPPLVGRGPPLMRPADLPAPPFPPPF